MAGVKQRRDWKALAKALDRRVEDDCFDTGAHEVLAGAAVRQLLVACSGGADSVFLLCLLYARREQFGLELSVAHYNHRWRGEASLQDAEFVRAIAQSLQLPFNLDVRPANEAAFTETTARALRLEFLRKAAAEAGCSWIAFGHQLDDILETQLQRIVRGVAAEGLAAPRPVARFQNQPTHLRPLLRMRSVDIRMHLNAVEIPWCEDSSNADTRISRNMLRHEVIPSLGEALGRDPGAGAARTRQLLEEDAIALDLLARECVPEAFDGAERLSRGRLAVLPRALLRRALTGWLACHGIVGSISAAALDLLIRDIVGEQERSKQSAGARFICFDTDWVWLEEDAPRLFLEHVQFLPGESAVLSNGFVIESEAVTLDAKLLQSILAGEVDPGREAVFSTPADLPLEVRSCLPGDRFRPLGAPGSKKLKDWLIDRHIPRGERSLLPVVTTSGGEIIWVPGFPPADSRKIGRETKQALRLTYRRRNPR